MTELDFSNIYNSTGKIVQLRYAQKAVDAGSTIIAMRNSKGAVLIVSKPIISRLYVQESDHRIKKVADNLHMAYTGILPDGFFITEVCRKNARNYKSQFQEDVNAKAFKETLGGYLYMFTQYNSARVIGANFLAIIKDGRDYRVIGADCAGKVTEYYGHACGSGERRAQTEIEKFDLESMEIMDLIDQGIKTLFRCHDSLSDVKFNVEVGMISENTDGEFVRMQQANVDSIVGKYKNISIDGEDD